MTISAPDSIHRLVENFDNHLDHYKSAGYNETQVRREFLDPLFKALGWDIDNERGYADAYKDVIHEDSIKIGGRTKAPDYCFRIGGQRKFFLEAKKPSINIKSSIEPAYQLRRYAWSAKLPLSILSDFEELAIYDCRVKPGKTDKSSTARIFYYKYYQYVEKWEEIAAIFSREAILKGAFDKYAESSRKKRGTAEVDDAFLNEIERWRKILAYNFALRNPSLSVRDLNFAVQKTIDRLIFLRISEDRGIEDYGRLQELQKSTNIYQNLVELFKAADERFNSGLFHFSNEKGRPGAPDTLTVGLLVDDKVIKDILKNLYYPDSPYEFSVLPADILGHVYEQFLGKTIRLTKTHNAKIEEKPEVRKAGGVYYTPKYIVDYIVNNTLGILLNGTNRERPRPIPISQAENIKVLDPACGSGSFLIVAYQYLLDWHRDQYTLDSGTGELDKGKINRHSGGKQPKIYNADGGEYRLTTSERKRILLNNIYGVDIDSQAVEVTKLSLLLKVLEGETQQTLQRDFFAERERILPDLGNNICCGNSLIGPDFYEQQTLSEFDEEYHYLINVFDWEAAFPDVFKKGGFDCVVGNPPWGGSISDFTANYLTSHYQRVIDRMVDTYVFFIDKCIQLIRPSKLIGLVIPATLLNQSDTKSIRHQLIKEGVHQLLNLGAGVFGKNATNTTLILIATRNAKPDKIYLHDLKEMELLTRARRLNAGKTTDYHKWSDLVLKDPLKTYFTSDLSAAGLLSKIQQSLPPLSSILVDAIQRGVTPDRAEMHLIEPTNQARIESDLLRKSLSANQIKRYCTIRSNQYIIYTTKNTDLSRYPYTLKHMEAFRSKLSCKEIATGKHPWWSLHRPRKREIFESPKFIGVTTSRRIEVIFDAAENLVVTDACYVLRVDPAYDYRYILGVLHSSLFLWMYRTSNQGDSRVIPQVKAAKMAPLPVPAMDFNNSADVAKQAKMVQLVERMLGLNKKLADEKNPEILRHLETQVVTTGRGIDRLTYDLYGLAEDEIAIVEKSGVDND